MGMPPPSSRSQPPRTQGTAYNMQAAPQQAAPQSASEWLGSTAGKDFLRNNPTYQAPATPPPAPAYQRPAKEQPFDTVYSPQKPQTTGFINPSVVPKPRQGWGDAVPYGQPIDAPLPAYTPQTPPGGWVYNKPNPTPAYNPVLPTPKPAPPAPVSPRSVTGQAQSAPPSAGQYIQPVGPGYSVPTPVDPLRYYPEDPRRPAPPSVPSLGPEPVQSPTRDGLAQYDPSGSSNRQAWMAAGRPGFNTDVSYTSNISTAADGTKFGNGGESVAYNKWRAAGGQSSTPAPTPGYQSFNAQAQQAQTQGLSTAASSSPRPPAPTSRGGQRYTRPEGYVPNSTLWAQHAPTPEPEQAPYNPNPPKAPKPNVFPEMQRGPSASYLASPGYSTQATWDQSQGKMGQASYNGAMTMNANMANPGGESLRPPGFTFNAQGVDGKQYANPADAIARRDALIASLGQQQARYSGSMGRNLGAPQFNMKQAMGQGAR